MEHDGGSLTRIAVLHQHYQEARATLQFLDANLWIGRPRTPEFAGEWGIERLCAGMARYGIQGGVVSHFAAVYYSPWHGNEALLAALEGTGLSAGVVLVPEMFGAPGEGREYLRDLISHGARFARVFPKTHNFILRPWCSGHLLEALCAYRVPLVVWHTEVGWEDVRAVCAAYPGLTVIIEGTPQKILYYNRILYPLLAELPNLRLELHNLANYLGVEDIVLRFGAKRLLFGSFLPICDPNVAMMQVTHARIGEGDKVQIANANLAELLGGVQLT